MTDEEIAAVAQRDQEDMYILDMGRKVGIYANSLRHQGLDEELVIELVKYFQISIWLDRLGAPQDE